MLPRLTVSVPQPCHENWQAMTPTAQGRHCAACNTVVTDFTRMTDAEVLAWLQRPATSTCGRFRQDQLQRPLRPAAIGPAPWRQWLAAATAVLGLGAAAPAAQAQQKPTTQQHTIEQHAITLGMVAVPKLPQPLAPPPLVVRGVVLDSASREPLPGVTVLVNGTTIGVFTNADGTFKLQLPEEYRRIKSINLLVSSVGYTSLERSINPLEADLSPLILAVSGKMMGKVIFTAGYYTAPWYSPRGLWQRLTRPFRRW